MADRRTAAHDQPADHVVMAGSERWALSDSVDRRSCSAYPSCAYGESQNGVQDDAPSEERRASSSLASWLNVRPSARPAAASTSAGINRDMSFAVETLSSSAVLRTISTSSS